MKRIVFLIIISLMPMLSFAYTAFQSLAFSYAENGNYEEALRIIETDLGIQSSSKDNIDYLTDLILIIEYTSKVDADRDITSVIDDAIRLINKDIYNSHNEWLDRHYLLASALQSCNQTDKAINIRSEILNKQVSIYGQTSSEVMFEMYMLAIYSNDAGRANDAIEWGDKAGCIAKLLSKDCPNYEYKGLNYGEIMRSLIFVFCEGNGHIDEAIKYTKIYCENLRLMYGAQSIAYQEQLGHLFVFFLDNNQELLASTISKDIALYGPVGEIQYELVNIVTYDKNIKYDPNAEKYAERLWALISQGKYNEEVNQELLKEKGYKYYTEEDAISALYSYYKAIDCKDKTFETARMLYDMRKEQSRDDFYDLMWLLYAANDMGDMGNYALSLASDALANNKYSDEEISYIRAAMSDAYQKKGEGQKAIEIDLKIAQESKSYGTLLALSTKQLINGQYTESHSTLCELMRLDSIPDGEWPEIRKSQAILCWLLQRHEELDSILPMVIKDFRNSLMQFSILPELQRVEYIKKSFYTNDILWDMMIRLDKEWNITGNTSVMYDYALLRKGILLSSQVSFKRHLAKLGVEFIQNEYSKFEKLQADYEANQVEIELIERELLMTLSNLGYDIVGQYGQWIDVRDSLADDEAAIEFVKSYGARGDDSDLTPFYYALIIRKGYENPHIVRCGPFVEVSKWLDLDDQVYDKKYNLPYLFFWGQLEDELKGVENIYFSPIDDLNNIAIEYICDYNGNRVNDKWNIHRISSTRELIDRAHSKQIRNLALFGGLDYELVPLQNNQSIRTSENVSLNSINSNRTRGLLATTRGSWPILKWTAHEINEIFALVADVYKIQATKYTGEDGREEAFYNLAKDKVNLLHFATHGFYYDDETVEDKQVDRRNYRFMLFDDDADTYVEDRSMTRSGLLLSGANYGLKGNMIPEGVEDGILTAQEISTIYFDNLDLVVLSACQTGLGRINGEGVFGLQRGFKKAGANSILMSLWNVADEATSKLMISFYENYFKGMSKLDALQNAQKALMESPRFSAPKYWAGWILLDAID